ncbi:MAG: hypothetical protein GY927_08790 [bacterium]|nr:hypothetical protein [bacterium]
MDSQAVSNRVCVLIANTQSVAAFQEVYQGVQDGPATIFFYALLVVMALGVAGCSDRGDYGRHDPSLFSKTYTSSIASARRYLGEEQDYDLPLTASEDALRTRALDMVAIRRTGVVAQIIPARSGDGFAHVAATIEDVKVDHHRFSRFMEAAKKVMAIDEARAGRLKGLDALMSQRQAFAVVERRGRNNLLIRDGVRLMRERSTQYRELLVQLPVERPEVPLGELQSAYDGFHEEVVLFHSEIDQRAHMRLGQNGKQSAK